MRRLTTCKQALYLFISSQKTNIFIRELSLCIPNSEVRLRRNVPLKKLIPEAMKRSFTDVLVVNEDRKQPSILT